MNLLTGLLREDFLKYTSYVYGIDCRDFELGIETYLNALLIEFLDSKGIYIVIYPNDITCISFEYKIVSKDIEYQGRQYNSRSFATNEAISTVNGLYTSL